MDNDEDDDNEPEFYEDINDDEWTVKKPSKKTKATKRKKMKPGKKAVSF